MKWTINSLEERQEVARKFLEYVGERKIFALYGAMGVGKTTFVKAIGNCACLLYTSPHCLSIANLLKNSTARFPVAKNLLQCPTVCLPDVRK